MQRSMTGILVLAALGAACGGDQATRPVNQDNTLAVAPGDPQAHGTVRGEVDGWNEGGNGTAPVAGVRVWIWHRVPDPTAPPDTVLFVRQLVGNLITGADGRFELTSVPEGEYDLAAIPPADSPFYPAQDFAMTAPGTGAIDQTILLVRGRTPGVSDLQAVVQFTDSAAHTTVPIAGAEVRVYALAISSTDPGSYDRRLVGSGVTDAAGQVSLNAIAEGQFLLWSVDVAPPSGSAFQPVAGLMVTASGTGLTRMTIELHH
jgi:hypothetical protein